MADVTDMRGYIDLLKEMGELREAGCVAVSDDGRPVASARVMRRALEYAKAFSLVVIDHCEEPTLAEKTCMNEGPVSTLLGLRGQPAAQLRVAAEVVERRRHDGAGRLHAGCQQQHDVGDHDLQRQPLAVDLGYALPKAIAEAGFADRYRRAMDAAAEAYPRVQQAQAAVEQAQAAHFESHGLKGMSATVGADACAGGQTDEAEPRTAGGPLSERPRPSTASLAGPTRSPRTGPIRRPTRRTSATARTRWSTPTAARRRRDQRGSA